MFRSIYSTFLLLLVCVAVEGFTTPASLSSGKVVMAHDGLSMMNAQSLLDSSSMVDIASTSQASSTMQLSAATLDPTTFLSDLLAGLLGTPAILAIPIVAALGVASLVAFFIVSYASPEVEDDE